MNPKVKRFCVTSLVIMMVAALLIPGATACQTGGAPAASSDIVVELSFSEPPVLGKPVKVTATFGFRDTKSANDNVTARITLSEGLVLIDGTLEWHGRVASGTKSTFSATVKAVKTGVWQIRATAGYPVGSDYRGGIEEIYAIVTDTGATISKTAPDLPGVPFIDMRDPANPKTRFVPQDKLPGPTPLPKPGAATTFINPK